MPPRASRTKRWFFDGIEILPVILRKIPIRRNARKNLRKRSSFTPTPFPYAKRAKIGIKPKETAETKTSMLPRH